MHLAEVRAGRGEKGGAAVSVRAGMAAWRLLDERRGHCLCVSRDGGPDAFYVMNRPRDGDLERFVSRTVLAKGSIGKEVMPIGWFSLGELRSYRSAADRIVVGAPIAGLICEAGPA